MNKITIESATQLNKILYFLPEDRKRKIPKDIWEILKHKNSDKLETGINKIEDIKEEKILLETRKYLSYIFLNYLATEEEKEEYIKIIKDNEEYHQQCLGQKYNVDSIFKKKEFSVKTKKEYIEKTELPIVYKENVFKIMINKIKNLFKK